MSKIFYLRNLNGTNGFAINGINPGDNSGYSVSWAGDVNKDGLDDVMIGAPNVNGGTGQSYVVFGSKNTFSAQLNLSNLNGTNGFIINGINQGDQSGAAVGGAGDITGDGFADLMVGSPGYQGNGIGYTVYGNKNFPAQFNLTDIDATSGIINYIGLPVVVGSAVGTAGDFNGDGIDDMMINGLQVFNSGSDGYGLNYIIFGNKNEMQPKYDLLNLNASEGFGIAGMHYDCDLGSYINSAGDVNGDGINDIIMSSNCNEQESYVVFGSRIGYGSTLSVNELNGSNGFIITGSGAAPDGEVSGVGDVNGDGIDDIIVGAPNANDGVGQGYVIFGSTDLFPANFDVSTLNGKNGFTINGANQGDNLGAAVSGIEDLNGDGYSDFIVGSPGALSNTGFSYLIYGNNTFQSVFNVTAIDGNNGMIICGVNDNDKSGSAIDSIGDFNGDNKPDFIIGASNGFGTAGQSYVVFGGDNFSDHLEDVVL